VNTASAEQLERIFREYGGGTAGEADCTQINQGAIGSALQDNFRTRGCGWKRSVPGAGARIRRRGVFQALRIAVNLGVLEVLERTLEQLGDLWFLAASGGDHVSQPGRPHREAAFSETFDSDPGPARVGCTPQQP
jgi:16S rRNA C1402 N4-methylase RsmH